MAQYERFKFNTNIPVEIDFKWDDGRFWEHEQYGISYTFNVHARWEDREGAHDEDVQIRVSPFLLDRMISVGVGKGSTITVEKVDGDSGKTDWLVAPITAPQEAGLFLKDIDRQTVDKNGTPVTGKVGGNTLATAPAQAVVGNASEEIDKLIETYAQIHARVCEKVYGVDPSVFEVSLEDVRTVATHISIAAQQRNLYLDKDPDSGFDPDNDLNF